MTSTRQEEKTETKLTPFATSTINKCSRYEIYGSENGEILSRMYRWNPRSLTYKDASEEKITLTMEEKNRSLQLELELKNQNAWISDTAAHISDNEIALIECKKYPHNYGLMTREIANSGQQGKIIKLNGFKETSPGIAVLSENQLVAYSYRHLYGARRQKEIQFYQRENKQHLFEHRNTLNISQHLPLDEHVFGHKISHVIVLSPQVLAYFYQLQTIDEASKLVYEITQNILKIDISTKQIIDKTDMHYHADYMEEMLLKEMNPLPDGKTFICPVKQNQSGKINRGFMIWDAETMNLYSLSTSSLDSAFFRTVLNTGEVVLATQKDEACLVEVYELPHIKSFFENVNRKYVNPQLMLALGSDYPVVLLNMISQYLGPQVLIQLSQAEKISVAANPASFYGQPRWQGSFKEPQELEHSTQSKSSCVIQ